MSIHLLLPRGLRRLLFRITVAAVLPFCGSAQIAFNASTSFAGGSGDRTISHAGAASEVKGALVLISSPMDANNVLAATYGGVPMTRVALSPALVAGEGGLADVWFLGAGVPQGTQNVVIDVSSTQTTAGAIITLTAAADIEVVDTKTVVNTSIANPAVTLVTPTGVETFICGVLFSGQDAVTGIAPGTGYTEINEVDFGTATGGTSRRTNIANGGNVVYDWLQTAEDAAMIAVAVREKAGAGAPPPAPTGLTATAVSSSQLDLAWTDVTGETSYKIERSPAGAGTWTQVGTNSADDVTFSDTGLPASTSFDYRVKGSNANGDSTPSNIASATTLPASPPAPTGLTATAVSSSQIDLSWTDVAGETSYKIERSPAGAGTWTQVGTNSADDVTFSDTGLPASTSFDYRVKASNTAGDSGPSNVASATTLAAPPPAPTGLTATAVSSSQIDLIWTDVAGETSYKIERSPAGAGTWTQVGTNSADDVTFLDLGLPASTSFDYRVKASNAGGDSAPSNVASATTDSAQLAFDATTSFASSSGDRTISHAPMSSEVKGALVLISSPMGANNVLAATYGGVPMTRVALSPALVAGEGGLADVWFLGAGVPQGTQNVVIDVSSTQTTAGAIITLTATADIEVVDTKTVVNTSIANPAVTLVTPTGVETFICGVLFSGQDAVTGIAPGAGYTEINEVDFGTATGGSSRRTNIATGGNVVYNWVQTAEDAAMIAVAVREKAGAGAPPPAPTGLTATAVSSSQIDLAWTDVAGETSYKIERSPAGAGTWTQVGTNSADDVTFSDTGLPANTSFDYRVKGSNANGDSTPSNIASATTGSSGYAFPTTPYTFPKFPGVINVRDHGATGNGVTDDTAAILNAITSNIGTSPRSQIIYFPDGVYLVSDRLKRQDASGNWHAHFIIQGESETETIIRLKNNSPGFNDSGSRKAVIYQASYDGYTDWATTGNGLEGFRNYVMDLTIDLGTAGNAGAVGISAMTHNVGAIRRVTVTGSGHLAGFDFTRPDQGPMMCHRLTAIGGQYGLDIGRPQTGITFEHVKLQNQTVAGIRNDSQKSYIRGLVSTNTVPVLRTTNNRAGVVIIDAVLDGGSASNSALHNAADLSGAKLFARNVNTTGYQSAVMEGNTVVPGANVVEYATGPIYSLWPTTIKTLGLAIKNTPEKPYPTLAQMTNVADFGVIPEAGSQTVALQAAIDSGAETLYFPSGTGRYFLDAPVIIRGNVKHIIFNHVWFQLSGTAFDNGAAPVFKLASTVQGPIVLERMRGNSGPAVPGAVLFEGATTQAVALKDCEGSYRSASGGSGDVFFDNYIGRLRLSHAQNIWLRQHNTEGANSGIIKTGGGDLWLLGLKTEQHPPFEISAGRFELLGGFRLDGAVSDVPVTQAAFTLTNVPASLIYCTHAPLSATGDFTVHVRETRSGVTRELLRSDLTRQGGFGSWVPLFRDGNP